MKQLQQAAAGKGLPAAIASNPHRRGEDRRCDVPDRARIRRRRVVPQLVDERAPLAQLPLVLRDVCQEGTGLFKMQRGRAGVRGTRLGAEALQQSSE